METVLLKHQLRFGKCAPCEPPNLSKMKTIPVKLENKELIVKQLPLKKYADLLKAMQNLPKTLGGLEGVTNEQIFEKLPTLIASSFPDVMAILTIATDLKSEEVEELSLNEAVKIFVAVIEVNEYKEVFEQIKKVLAQPKTVQAIE